MNAATVEATRAERSADTVSALERGIAVLRCFTEDRRVLGPTELSRLTGVPRPTVTRLASTLVGRGRRRGARGGAAGKERAGGV